MKFNVNNKALGILLVIGAVLFVYAATDTISSSNDVALNISGGNLLIQDDAGQMSVEIYSGNSNSDALLRLGNNTNVLWHIYNDGNAADELVIGDHDETVVFKILQDGDIIMDPQGNNVLPGTDNADLLGKVAGGNQRWADVRSVLINGADICFENDWCFTECRTFNELDQPVNDLCLVTEKPTADQAITIGVAAFNNYQEYVDSHMIQVCHEEGGELICEWVFDGSMDEPEFLLRWSQTRVDGILDLLLGRESKGNFRKIKEVYLEQQRIKEFLCNQGALQFCED